MPRPVITLTTDFGASSPYVAQMKGVILAIHCDVELVDVTHAIPPQQILAGAVTLADTYRHFPAGTIHVAVVDPGVGSDRAIVLAEMAGHCFVAPDNGLLGMVARESPPTRLVRVEAAEFWKLPISPTFHGRDIMAPVAAHLASGVGFERFGSPQRTLATIDVPAVEFGQDFARGTVLTIDSFGNVVTNLNRDMLPANVSHGALQIDDLPASRVPIVTTYAEYPAEETVVLIGSSHRLEVAVVGGNAAIQLGIQTGSRISVHWQVDIGA